MVVLKVVRDRKEGATSLCFYRNNAPPRWTASAGDTVVRTGVGGTRMRAGQCDSS
jgi:hypothetical protein